MISRLKSFVPVVGNTHDLQNKKSDIGTWFLTSAAKVNARILSGNTSQGFYVMGADGKAYAYNNNRSVERVLDFMQRGSNAFRNDPPTVIDTQLLPNPHPKPPEGTTVIRVYSRITPLPDGCPDANANLQRDHLWILPNEAADIADGKMPHALTNRLCRFVLVDAIRGEPDFWKPAEVRLSSFAMKVSGPSQLSLTGRFSMQTADNSRGIEGTLTANIAFEERSIRTFQGFADATAWGAGTYTPGAPEGKFPLKFAFILAPKAADTVAPQAAMYGRDYLDGR